MFKNNFKQKNGGAVGQAKYQKNRNKFQKTGNFFGRNNVGDTNQQGEERSQKSHDKFFINPSKNKFKNKGKYSRNKPEGEHNQQVSERFSGENFFIKPSKSGFKPFPVLNNNRNFGFKESKINKKISPDKSKSQDLEETNSTENEKRPFDKKLYRLKKYSNKFKVQQWEEQRKKVALRNLKRSTKRAESEEKLDVQKIYEEHEKDLNSDDEDVTENVAGNHSEPERSLADKFERQEQKNNKKSFKRAQKFDDIKAEKQAKREEFLKKKQEKEEALKVYQQKKTIKFKKLSMRTKKGQPVMKGRMELLLEQIQDSIQNET